MDKNKIIRTARKRLTKLLSVLLALTILLELSAAYINAVTYYTVRVNYLYTDGTHAHDPYIATFPARGAVDVTVTNPTINGYDPMRLNEGETNPLALPNNGTQAKTIDVHVNELNSDVNYTVYYVAGLSHYRARFYLQNIYDDLYTTDQTLNAQFQDKLDITGSFPDYLEEVKVEGFTSLFHEPDAIAADGSTVFRLYYDRNYYSVGFDLGEGGYGVEPIYAKYQTVYHVDEPKRLGYTFRGWARTDKDSAVTDDWNYIDENGNVITEEAATATENLLQLDGDQVVPAKNTYYKAVWSEGTTRYSVVYWLENADNDEYSVIAAKDIENVPSGTELNYEDIIKDYDFFSYNLSTEFPTMSSDQITELNGMGRYFELNENQTLTYESQFTNGKKAVSGDGTTRVSLFYDRKEITQRFYYARKTDSGEIQLAGSTKAFSSGYGTFDQHLSRSCVGTTPWTKATNSLPQISKNYADKLEVKTYYSAPNQATYYYYELKTKYAANLRSNWFLDAIDPILVEYNSEGPNDYARFGAWSVEWGTPYARKSNKTVKGIYEKLDKQLLYEEQYLNDHSEVDPYVLNYLAFWTNVKQADWNKQAKVYNFTYLNYTEILRIEYDENGDWNGQGGYIDTYKNENTGKIYGLLPKNVIETFDAGGAYDNKDTRDTQVKAQQTAAALIGFTLMTDAQAAAANFGANPKCEWVAKPFDYDGDGVADYTFNADHHCNIRYFYRRNEHNVEFRNNNVIDKTVENVFYGRSLESFEYVPTYNNPPELADYYTFEGWYYTPYYFRKVDFSTLTMGVDDITLYAKWVPKKIDVVFYNNYNDYYEDTNRIVLGRDDENNPLTEWTVEYGSYVPLNHIPADVHDGESTRPELTPIADKASFAGWYYIRNRTPRRFEPENVPVIALNAESTGDNAKLRLFAEWVTQDVAKYKVNYVRADDPTVEVAPPTVGRAYVWKTRTFHAKSGDALSDEYKWTEEHENEGTNWWPTVNSHSIIVKANEEGEEYRPNESTFTYIQKDKVHYRIQYLDADTHRPINPEGHDIEKISTHASVKEDARVIPGYIADPTSQTLILSASTADTPEEQEAEELRNNVITFLYHKNVTEYVYETEYYTKNLEGDDYSLFGKESLEIPIAASGATTVAVQDLFMRPLARQIESEGFERAENKVVYTSVNIEGTVSGDTPVADDGTITIVDTDKKTIRLYFERKSYPYFYKYIDHSAAKAYEQATEEERASMWDGVLKSFTNNGTAPVGTTVTIPAATDYNYTNPTTQEVTAYTRLTKSDGTLDNVTVTIQPAENGSLVNLVKIYYRKDIERDLNYQMVCVNKNGETDYDTVTGDPLFGRLSVNRQTVESFDQIQDVTFHDTNDEKIREGSSEIDMHLHRYDFLGWYTTPAYDEQHPEQHRLTTNPVLKKEDLGTNGSLPDRDVKYYALVKQKMVQMDVDFYFCDEYTKNQITTMSDAVFKEYLQQKIDGDQLKPCGEYGGKEVIFSSPSLYENHTQIAWHKTDGYSLYMQNVDNKVYKYEFAEWWEIDEAKNNDLIPKHNWNSGEWSPDSLASQLSRTKNQHLIAVYARREVTELPYTLNYKFTDRYGDNKTYVKAGTLTGDDLNENSENTKITRDGFYALTDEFILANAPYESNFAQVLNWTDHPDYVNKNSVIGDSTHGTVDRIITDVNAAQSKKTVFANFRTTPTGEYTSISIPYGSNYKQSENMLAITAAEEYGGKPFAYWEVRKTESGAVVAKSYEPLFDLCMMDSYWMTPVYADEKPTDESFITLTHIDNTRNTWTDDKNEVPEGGTTDKLYADFEIAFKDGATDIYTSTEGTYRTGVVFEQCKTLGANEVFDAAQDYGFESNPDTLKAAILDSKKQYAYSADDSSLTRKLQVSDIPRSSLTNHDRVQYSKRYSNNYKIENEEKTYTNGRYLLKATAYLIKDGQVTLSNSVYVCLAAEAEKDLAIDNGKTASIHS